MQVVNQSSRRWMLQEIEPEKKKEANSHEGDSGET
jgi:hypothetical protein